MALDLGQRLAFRSGVIYFVAYSLFNGNVDALPFVNLAPHGRVPDWYSTTANYVVAAMGHVLGLHGEIRGANARRPGGNGRAASCRSWKRSRTLRAFSTSSGRRTRKALFIATFQVGCGYAARSNGEHIRVVRLSDGQSWLLSNALTDPWGWSEPLALTCTELFATVRNSGVTRLARVRLDSLGPGIAPD